MRPGGRGAGMKTSTTQVGVSSVVVAGRPEDTDLCRPAAIPWLPPVWENTVFFVLMCTIIHPTFSTAFCITLLCCPDTSCVDLLLQSSKLLGLQAYTTVPK